MPPPLSYADVALRPTWRDYYAFVVDKSGEPGRADSAEPIGSRRAVKMPQSARWAIVALSFCAIVAGVSLLVAFRATLDSRTPLSSSSLIPGLVAPTLMLIGIVPISSLLDRPSRPDEETARERLRAAEEKLAGGIADSTTVINIGGDVGDLGDLVAQLGDRGRSVGSETDEAEGGEQSASRVRSDDRLALSALWEVTHSRLDLYHQIATGQARRSFFTAQAATGVGFILLVVFAILAASAQSTAGAVTTGALGAVSAALAGYIGRTFVRSQESAASHLRAYFDQPLEFSKYLAAERLLADRSDLTVGQRAEITAALVQGILAQNPRSEESGKNRSRRGAKALFGLLRWNWAPGGCCGAP